jgi:kelch-like protein 19
VVPDKTSEIQLLKCKKVVRERLHITGGIQKNDYFSHKAILEFNPETGTYITRGAMCTGRYNHGMAQLGNEIYLVGGNSGFFEQLRSVESYSPEHEQWTVKPSMREARDEFSLAVCDGCLYAIGGHNGIQDLRSVEKFDARENSWSFVSPMKNYRAGACAVAVSNR